MLETIYGYLFEAGRGVLLGAVLLVIAMVVVLILRIQSGNGKK